MVENRRSILFSLTSEHCVEVLLYLQKDSLQIYSDLGGSWHPFIPNYCLFGDSLESSQQHLILTKYSLASCGTILVDYPELKSEYYGSCLVI